MSLCGAQFSPCVQQRSHVLAGIHPSYHPLGTVLPHLPVPKEVVSGPVRAILNLGGGLGASVCALPLHSVLGLVHHCSAAHPV